MKVTPYTEVITVCLMTFLVTFPFNPCAISTHSLSYSFSISANTNFSIAVYTSAGLSESHKLTYALPFVSLPNAE